VGKQKPLPQSNMPQSIEDAIKNCYPKPPDEADRGVKKNWAEKLSNEVAKVLAVRLRTLGVPNCQPDENAGRERQFAGGIGAKKLDVSFATETGGLILGISIKSISFPDPRTKNFAKNLTNRRGDLLAEATTLHQRFPYAVLGAFFLFDERADADGTDQRLHTFQRAREIFRMFTSRTDRSNSVERYEVLAVAKFNPEKPFNYSCYLGGDKDPIALDGFLLNLLQKVAERNPDHFRFTGKGLSGSRM
jgi:hypothetical protein